MKNGKSFTITQNEVLEAYKRVKANKGAGGIDGTSIEEFEKDWKNRLYKLWNRMASGSYYPKAVRGVEIPKKDGTKRLLGIPAIEDRVAQMVTRQRFEPKVEPIFKEDSYGYRSGKSAIDAVGKARERCFKKPWVIELDIKGLFDNIDHEKLMEMVRKHTEERWVVLYIERFLKAPIKMPDGTNISRTSGVPQGGVISPVLSNLYMHYAFDCWMTEEIQSCQWERYADDGLIHCVSQKQAEYVRDRLGRRMKEYGLELHPGKTKIIYCKNDRNKEVYENISFTFLGYTFRPRAARDKTGKMFQTFSPAVSKENAVEFRKKIRMRCEHGLSDDIEELAKWLNPVIRGWYNYFGKFYKSEAYKILEYVNTRLYRWYKRTHKRAHRSLKKAKKSVGYIAKDRKNLFYHWELGLVPAI